MIDLRSDTVTKPTEKMLEAMFQAKVGDDVYKEDATINLLEERIADMFGMEQALFFPTGTMANQTAIKLHTQPGDQVICDKDAHIYHYEGGGASFNSGVSCKLVHGDKGMFASGQVIEAINPPDFYHSPLTALVEVENTANRGGGSCWDFEELKKIRAICDQNHLGFHLDGARLWNALIAKNESPKQYGQLFDTISVCLSKGLGCPVGSVLVGKKELMKNAMRIRKILGGGMRQVGYLGAAGLYALDNHVERLKEDHQRAKEIEMALNKLDMVKLVTPVETNIVIFELNQKEDEKTFLNHLQENKIVLSGMGNGKLRIVTHLDYTQEMHERFLEVLSKLSAY
ncbi:aminotransferase class I/II-fold pyridoxal phosphate-dependent enzyme [Mangrovimonas sp. CR14]|uniref:threonine aldolase family protein n=1 Tax=Mangrovimonas sp. CR14 TaxID=2706120 RepID=UPI0014229926|nr:GntG family PLP-dependent aldolase [Mangrovimonas sp. CR14]NIK91952.1 aminotransferase class I/II-fold pyridoxal phosphate-dependent enzyme [Mangrovimonas sp. CR14]